MRQTRGSKNSRIFLTLDMVKSVRGFASKSLHRSSPKNKAKKYESNQKAAVASKSKWAHVDHTEYGVNKQRLERVFKNHGPFSVTIPDHLWAEHDDMNAVSEYLIEGITTMGDGKTIACLGIPRKGVNLGSSAFPIPVEFIVHPESSNNIRCHVRPIHPENNGAAETRAHYFGNFLSHVQPEDALIILDTPGRNVNTICDVAQNGKFKWHKDQIYVMEMNPVHVLYMWLNGMRQSNVIYTPYGFEHYITTDPAFEELRPRVRGVYADYYGKYSEKNADGVRDGRGKERLMTALETLPNLEIYGINFATRCMPEEQGDNHVLDGFYPANKIKYGTSMQSYFFARQDVDTYH